MRGTALRPAPSWAIVLCATLAGIAAAPASEAHARAVDLASEADLRLDGAAAGDLTGGSVGGGCDVDGDGRSDAVVGAFAANAAYVVLGRSEGGEQDLGALGEEGFRIDGAADGDSLGFSVDCAGDVNGDGIDDVVVGAFGADDNGRSTSGSAYVVFGKRGTAPVDLADLGDRGFRIEGEAAGDRAGSAVAGAEDIDGDGLADVIVGANAADNNGRDTSGSAYVVSGKRGTAPVDLADLGERGYRIDGAAPGDRAGFAIDGTGDVNGDGTPDTVVGAYTADPEGRETAGSSYVVFGKADSSRVDLADLGDGGYAIDGEAAGDRLGISVAGAGDVDGDGAEDLLVGADQAPSDGAGRAYVLFGKSGTARMDLAELGDGGYRIEGAVAGDLAGFSVDDAGDVDGDGRPDAIVGAYGADNNGREGSGSAYVVFGKGDSAAVALAGFEQRDEEGFRIDGEAAGDRAGRSVAGAGDFDGAGVPDALVGADLASPRERERAGAAYVQFGPGGDQQPEPEPEPEPEPDPRCEGERATIAGTRDDDRLVGTSGSDVIVARGGDDRIVGRGGDDVICAGAGSDRVRAGGGDDRVKGGRGEDRVAGGSGDDRLFGNRDRDMLLGGSGDDRLRGGPGRDELRGGSGRNRCRGGGGRDTLRRCG